MKNKSRNTARKFVSTLKVYGIRHEVTGKNRPDQNAYQYSLSACRMLVEVRWQRDIFCAAIFPYYSAKYAVVGTRYPL
jgi:hypothetical protein